MKGKTTGLAIAGIVFLGLGGAMAITNPGPAEYDNYATRRLSQYLIEQLCPNPIRIPAINMEIKLGEGCVAAVEQNQAQLKGLISANTTRQNYGVLSVYKTTLSPANLLPGDLAQIPLSQMLPTYQFETVAVLGQYYTYPVKNQ